MKIGVVIVNFNKQDLLHSCLKSLAGLMSEHIVIVVDNGSVDQSVEMVRNEFSGVSVVEMKENSGFCKANNIGIGRALENACDAVFILNNDTEVDSRCIRIMIDVLDPQKKIGMIAPKILLVGDSGKIDSAGLVITPDGYAKNRGLLAISDEYDRVEEVFCPAGAAALYARELLEDIRDGNQYFDENFSFYQEDLDLGWRARLKGWKCMYLPNAIVQHRKGATASLNSSFMAYYSNRNIFFNIIKNYPLLFLMKALFLSFLRYPLLLIGMVMRMGAGSRMVAGGGAGSVFVATLKSFRDALCGIPKMMKKRRKIQSSMCVDKREIERWFSVLGVTFFRSLYK